MKDLFTLEVGPFNEGPETLTLTAYMDEERGVVGFRCEKDGKTHHVYLNPSLEGDSPDVFVYDGETGDPGQDLPTVFINL